ncbi:MAG: NINE protein [Saprospiraceae bacterium]|jgi:TM2 domain-containing membrane protein YozV|nr:NINE protein [Saprospiraceae bacterium]MDP4820519.1 NINE protein [Saprospiraceae bacterium]MDP4997965.1 NINE protein [Saprospiraceae bacterium]
MRDKNIAGVLALFFGWIGLHRFYLRQTALGVLSIVFFWTGIPALIGFIDALVFFTMDKDEFDIKYNKDFVKVIRSDRRKYRAASRESTYQESAPSSKKRERPPRASALKSSGIEKFKDYDYQGAIEDFQKGLELSPDDVTLHFNLACSYSLTEQTEKSFYHLDRAVTLGFNDYNRIKTHDALAFLRIQPDFEAFEKNNYRLSPNLKAVKEEVLDLNETGDLLEQLKRLGELRERGLLSDEEFIKEKKKLLNT